MSEKPTPDPEKISPEVDRKKPASESSPDNKPEWTAERKRRFIQNAGGKEVIIQELNTLIFDIKQLTHLLDTQIAPKDK
jgi:hypothetical protein